jgi:transcriptional regulator with XRE-family HTH domain
MNLRDYLSVTNQTQEAFAEQVGLTRETINRYLNQPRIPKREHCLRISKATGGEVTEKDFSQEHILKIKTLVDRYDIKIKELAYVLDRSEVAVHNKLSFRSSTTEWEIYLMLNYISKTVNKYKKRGRKNAI